MKKYRYQLQKYDPENGKGICPDCGQKTFVYYIDTENDNRIIHEIVGRCDRQEKCGYNYTPRQFFLDNNINHDSVYPTYYYNYIETSKNTGYNYANTPEINAHFDTIEWEEVKNSLDYCANTFTSYLLEYLKENYEVLDYLINAYKIGGEPYRYDDNDNIKTSNVIFWQIDVNNEVRTGKIMDYDQNGHRSKYINWIHKDYADYVLRQCLFGEHLLNNNNDTDIWIVEAEKTAIMLKGFLMLQGIEGITVLAAGGLENLNVRKLRVFENTGKNVLLIPDLGPTSEIKWLDIATKARQIYGINIATVNPLKLYHSLTGFNSHKRIEGTDIADYLATYQKHLKFHNWLRELHKKKNITVEAVY